MATATLADVQAVYSGPEGALWELIMGQQIHIGGLLSSRELAEAAGIGAGMRGIDLCCCTGAGMRYLVRMHQIAGMTGVDATPAVIATGRQRNLDEGLADRIAFVEADVCDSGLASGSADFVWGEDAWCYVADKPRLIAEAARLVKPGGVVAFTDWVAGGGLADAERERFNTFMKFPNIQTLDGYASLLARHGLAVEAARDTGRFAPCIKLYLDMLTMQFTYDALKILQFDLPLMQAMGQEMGFILELANAGKILQGLFVARNA